MINENWINYNFTKFPQKSNLEDFIKVRKYLIELARNESINTITYERLIADCNISCDLSLNKYIITNILTDILFYEFVNNRGFLTSLVVSVTTGIPSFYFYILVNEYEKDKYGLEYRIIFNNTKSEVINFWKNNDNYNDFKDYKSFYLLKKEYYKRNLK